MGWDMVLGVVGVGRGVMGDMEGWDRDMGWLWWF